MDHVEARSPIAAAIKLLPSPASLIGDLTGASVAMLLTVTYALSYGALIFSGPLESLRPHGFAMILTATAILPMIVALGSSLPWVLAGTDANISAVLAVVVTAIAADLGADVSGPTLLATVLIALSLAACLTGVFLVILGAARAGQIVRFIPYPVMAGFLGATGWFVASGGLSVGGGITLNVAGLEALATAAPWPRLLASVAVAATAFLLVPRLRHFLTLPGLIVLGIVAHHIAFAALGLDGTYLRAHGWIMTVPDKLPLSTPWAAANLAEVDWSVLAIHWGDLVAIMVVTAMTILVNISGL